MGRYTPLNDDGDVTGDLDVGGDLDVIGTGLIQEKLTVGQDTMNTIHPLYVDGTICAISDIYSSRYYRVDSTYGIKGYSDNQEFIKLNIVVGGSDSTLHSLKLQIDSADILKVSATGDGAGGIDATTKQVDIAGSLSISGLLTTTGIEETFGAGAIDIVSPITLMTTEGGVDNALTLADGVEGQLKTIVLNVHDGDAVVTPAHLWGASTTLTFSAAGESIQLLFFGSVWMSLGYVGVAWA